jgi:hypothetical protein
MWNLSGIKIRITPALIKEQKGSMATEKPSKRFDLQSNEKIFRMLYLLYSQFR